MIAIPKVGVTVGVIVLVACQAAVAQAVKKEREAKDAREIREVMTRWNDAYRRLDAQALASLEAVNIEIVDRFGELHRLTDGSEKEAFWADGFAIIARDSTPPELTIGQIHLISHKIATVHTCTHFREGIRLEDGTRIPPLCELNSYLLLKTHGEWRIAQVAIHDQTLPEGWLVDCTALCRSRNLPQDYF
jgi:ketosteroid isomerase-like protein